MDCVLTIVVVELRVIEWTRNFFGEVFPQAPSASCRGFPSETLQSPSTHHLLQDMGSGEEELDFSQSSGMKIGL